MIISAEEYMKRIRDIYSISVEEKAEVFTEALFSYFINGDADVYSPSEKMNYINQLINNVSFYDCRELSAMERFNRQTLARYIANAYARSPDIDWTFCTVLIAFVLRNDLKDVVNFVENQAKKLNVKKIMFQTFSNRNSIQSEWLSKRKATTFYYETKKSQKCLMEIWNGTTFYDKYNDYADYDIKFIEETYDDSLEIDYFIIYFVNLDVIRVKRRCDGQIFTNLPEELQS